MENGSEFPARGLVRDLDVGETVEIRLPSRETRRITLREVREPRCAARGTIRFPEILVEVDGARVTVPSAHYHMPVAVGGIRISCPVTRGIAEAVGRRMDVYALDRDARIRVWEEGVPLFGPDPLVYPARQAWFASMTQMANERTYVDGGELAPPNPEGYVYHHYGMDIGGHDKAVPVVAAHRGQVVLRGEENLPGYRDEGGGVRYDRVVVRDEWGWHYLYSHLDAIDPGIGLGDEVAAGDSIGALGKEGASGGWSHLHFGITSLQPSGRYGQVEGYPFLVEACMRERPGSLMACARPHLTAAPGETVTLDGGRSLCEGSEITGYRWTFHDGQTREGVRVSRAYAREGMYSEMLTVTDARGRTDVDFCVVQILPPDGDPRRTPPSMHLTCYPTDGIRAGQPVAFKVRTFFRGDREAEQGGAETWDFGDGKRALSRSGERARVPACADLDFDERWHAYDRPGRYIVTVSRAARNGLSATAQVKVSVAS